MVDQNPWVGHAEVYFSISLALRNLKSCMPETTTTIVTMSVSHTVFEI